MTHEPSYEELERKVQELEKEMLIRTRAEEALRESEKRYRSLVETSSDWLWEIDANLRYSYVNSGVREIFGYEPEEVVGRTPFDLMPEEEARRVEAIFVEISAERRPFAMIEHVNLHRDGRRIVLETSGVPVFGPDGEFTGYRGMDRDITERKRTEDALKERERKFRAIFDQTFQFMGLLTVDGRLIEANRNALQFAGVRESDVTGKLFWETPWWTHSTELQEMLRGAVKKAAAGEFVRFETIHYSADGNPHWMDFSLKPIMDESGRVTFLIAEARDITERRNAEVAMRLSESRLTRAEVVARFGSWEFRLGSNEVYASEGAKIIYGLEGSKWSIPQVKEILLPEFRRMLDDALTGLIEEGKPYNVEFKIRRPTDGKIRDIHSIAEYSPEKEVVFGVVQDVTERRQAEESLRDNETRLRAITDSARDAILMMGPEGAITYWNPAAERILGYTREEACGQNLHRLLAPVRYHTAYHEAFPRFMETGQGRAIGRTLELVARRKNGEEIPVELSLSAVFLGGWQAVGLLRDITERKQAEAALKESQQQLADIIDFLPDATFVIDSGGKVIAWNRAMEEMSGIGAADVVGKSNYEYALPFYDERRPTLINLVFEPNEEVKEKYSILERKGNVLAAEIYLKDLRGGEAYLFGTASALYDSRGNIIGAIESIRNITERKLMEKAVVDAEARYRDIFENSVTGIFQTSPAGRFLSVNASIANMLGYDSTEELIDSVIHVPQLYVHPERRSEMLRLIEEHGWVREFEAEYFRKDKSVIWVSLNIRSVPNSTGGIAYLEGTVSDITDAKFLRAQLEQAQKMEAVGTLAGGIAHDFNNILAPIIGYTELSLNSVPEDSSLHQNMSQVLLSANRAKDLVRQILTFSRKTEHERKPVQVSLLIKETLKLLRSSLPSTIDIRQAVHQDAFNSTTMADPTQIHQVLMNLCTNAAHAMRAKGGTLAVTLENVEIGPHAARGSPEMEPGPSLKLSVVDTGHGMDEAVKQRIFDPYFTTKGPSEGTGLGLAVVYGIVKDLSGAIAVSSKPGRGTTFNVYFPRTREIPSPVTELLKPLPTGHGRVLVVDDEKSIVDMIKEMLESLGYEAVPRYSSYDAIEAFRARPKSFELVITDMTMPHMTGIHLAKEILRIRPQIPIILCTGFSDTVDENKIKLLGIKELLMKPVSMRDLAVVVKKLLEPDHLPS